MQRITQGKNMEKKALNHWWRGGSLYQVYPRSFQDSQNDGVGDLPGLVRRLDHIQSLNVEGLWLGPIFKSPMVDFGYDVSDYYSIDPLFGSMEDFEKLLEEAHDKKLKVVVDLVLSHTSKNHPWFLESLKDPEGPYGDYYVWSDATKENKEPNNWLSVFGGPAWTFHPDRNQYYFHNFLKEQPDLNFHNEKVQEEILNITRFWLEKGVDGFRLDACNCYFHNPNLNNNPIAHGPSPVVQDENNPYFEQAHIFDKSQPENKKFMARLRDQVDSFEDRFLLGEIFCDREEQTTREYTAGGAPLHSAYNFSLLGNQRTDGLFQTTVSKYHSISPDTAWCLSNHDVTRVISRWPDNMTLEGRSKAYITLLSGLPGLVILYQGEELGLTEAYLPHELRQDPFGDNIESPYPGRDGCRTPMPWNSEKNCGFSKGKPWLPIPDDHHRLNVEAQLGSVDSTLNFTKRLFKMRQNNETLRRGNIQFWRDDQDMIAYSRIHGKQSFLFVASFTNKDLTIEDLTSARLVENLCSGLSLDQSSNLRLDPGAYGVIEMGDAF